jgi:hypothetical protein
MMFLSCMCPSQASSSIEEHSANRRFDQTRARNFDGRKDAQCMGEHYAPFSASDGNRH